MNCFLVREELKPGCEYPLPASLSVHITARKLSEFRIGSLNGPLFAAEISGGSKFRILREIPSVSETRKEVLCLALVRPKVMIRMVRSAAILGFKKIHIFNTFHTDKSFWQSDKLGVERLEEAIVSGLEQAVDTILPEITQHRFFRPFAEDFFPAGSGRKIVAHPYGEAYRKKGEPPSLLMIGPEAGFIPFELEMLRSAGAEIRGFSGRILSSETALPYLAGAL